MAHTEDAHPAERADQQREEIDRLRRALRDIEQVARIGAWELDAVTLQPTWSQGVYDIHELDPAAHPDLGEAIYFYAPEARGLIQSAVERALEFGEPYDLTVPLVTARGRHLWVRTMGAAQWESGRIVRLSGAFQDVTASYRIEERMMRASRASAEGHWESDFTTREVWLSGSFRELLGHPPVHASMTIDGFLDLMHPDDVPGVRQIFDAHVQHGAPYEVEFRLRTTRGEWRWFRSRGQAKIDESGALRTLTGSTQDIDRWKRIEVELGVRNQLLEELSRLVPGMLYQCRLTPQGEMSVPYASEAIERLYGCTAEAARSDVGLLVRVIDPRDVAAFNAAVASSAQTLEPFNLTYRVNIGDRQRWYSCQAAPEREPDGSVVWHGYIWDHTDRVLEQESLREARDAAEAASRAKGAFLANMSHEIRTPMNGVLGMTELLLGTDLDAEQRQYLETLRASGSSLLAIINDILDLSKIEAGRVELEHVPFDLRGVVEESVATLALAAHAKDVDLIADIEPALPERFLGDPVRMRQICLNLLSNAVKFTAKGEVVLCIRHVADARAVDILVRDTGVGIAPQVLQRLFQPFMQADASTTRTHGGTGLGLSIVKRLVELMHGSIEVASTVGTGSEFRVRIPLEAVPHVGHSSFHPALHARTLLVASPRDSLRRVIGAELSAHGARVLEASDVVDLQRLLAANGSASPRIHALLVDERLAGGDLAILEGGRAGVACIVLCQPGTSQAHEVALRLPVRRLPLLEAVTSAVAPPPARMRVLVVAQNSVDQLVARRLLEKQGCEVSVTASVRDGVTRVLGEKPDLVLLDVEMPALDGLEAVRELRAREPAGRRTPVVALALGMNSEERSRCLASGMDGVLGKPLQPQQLLQALREHLTLQPVGARTTG